MAALTPTFWSLETQSYWLEFYSNSFASGIVADSVKCILFSVFTGVLTCKSITMLKLLRKRRGEKQGVGVYPIASLILFTLFVIGTILYCTKVLLSLKQVMCAVATWDTNAGEVKARPPMRCRAAIRNGYIQDTVDRVLRLTFALNAQIILSIVNGVLVYRVCKVYSDMRAIRIPFMVLYLLWIVISFIQLYTHLNWYWSVFDLGGDFDRLAFQELRHLAFALSFILNLLVTIAIATRRILAFFGKSIIPEGGHFPVYTRKTPVYNMAKILLVDAALPVTLSSLCVLVAYSQYVAHWQNKMLNVQGIFAVLWLMSSTIAPLLIAIHHLRAEMPAGRSRKVETVIGDWAKFRDSSLDMDVVAVKTLSYSKPHPTPAGELNV
ncbi:hypothetical protein MD484_g2336, partial [Candolleomyces efflorescens]